MPVVRWASRWRECTAQAAGGKKKDPACTPVGIMGATQKSEFIYDGDLKSKSGCGVEFVEL